MNSGYELVMQSSSVEVLMGCSRNTRQQLMQELSRLKDNPFDKGERVIRDLSGRDHQVHMVRSWEIVYWADHAVKEVRITRLRKV